jgi:hypothetical protein
MTDRLSIAHKSGLARCTVAAWLILNGGCATFANVRSADVSQGSSFTTQISAAGHPGPVAGWFFAFDCENLCPNESPTGMDVNYTYGARSDGGTPYSVGVGIASIVPYVEGYIQLSDSKTRPFGVGARLGAIGQNFVQGQVFGRYDIPLNANIRFMWNPGVYVLNASSGDGIGHGSFIGITQGVGLQLGAGSFVFTPSAAVVWGMADRTAWSRELGPESHLFGTVGVAIGFRHDPRGR